MGQTIRILAKQGLPGGDSDELSQSTKTFPDGRRWRLEIPSVEGPAAMQAVLDEARDRHLTVDRVSQGSGIFMLSHAEINQMLELGSAANTEVCLFVGPRASWDIGKQPVSSAGSVASPTLRGADQVRYALEDVRQATEIGLRSILVGDVGLLAVIGRAKREGDLPDDLVIKTSVALACANPAMARLLEDLGATSINLGTDLSLAQIAAIRQAIDTPIDVYCEAPDDFGGAVRHYEVVDMVRVGAPIYIKYTVRNAPGIYPSGQHLESTVLATARERVRRASLGVSLLDRYSR
ncbi:MAG: hypothetical protein CBC12_04405 [Candidatus Puniceispirillum sp. TMED52]|nr:MAG: hypothetical protein CBC12_04405 [Candidatus Puniceispirillum sp. TMED52]